MNSRRNNSIPAVFLDRDGTIIEDLGHLSDPSQVVFFRDTVPSLRRLCVHFPLFLVTNQSGVAKRAISMQDVERVNAYIDSYLREHGIRLSAIYVCPHDRLSDCHCMKPKPYFLKKAEQEFGIDLRGSFVVGDHPHDVDLAINAGASPIYVLSGHGAKHLHEIRRNPTCANGIGEAAEIILTRMERI